MNTGAVPSCMILWTLLRIDKGGTQSGRGTNEQEKLMLMHRALLPREDIDKLSESWKEERRILVNIEECIDTTIQELKKYTKKAEERLPSKNTSKFLGSWDIYI